MLSYFKANLNHRIKEYPLGDRMWPTDLSGLTTVTQFYSLISYWFNWDEAFIWPKYSLVQHAGIHLE